MSKSRSGHSDAALPRATRRDSLVFAKLGYEVQLQIAADFLVRKGFHPKLGARPMRDATERHLCEAVVRDLLRGGTGCGRLTPEPGEDRLWVERKNGLEAPELKTTGALRSEAKQSPVPGSQILKSCTAIA